MPQIFDLDAVAYAESRRSKVNKIVKYRQLIRHGDAASIASLLYREVL